MSATRQRILILGGDGEPRALLHVPEYLAFRVIRSHFTIADVLSRVYRQARLFPMRSETTVYRT